MADFTIGGVKYQSRLFDGRKQIHVARRMLPVFNALVGIASSIEGATRAALTYDVPDQDGDENDGDRRGFKMIEQLAATIAPVTIALSKLSDADTDFVIDACLSVTEREVSNGLGWVPVRQGGGVIQDPFDATFSTSLMIAGNVVAANFSAMFGSLGIDLPGLMSKAGG